MSKRYTNKLTQSPPHFPSHKAIHKHISNHFHSHTYLPKQTNIYHLLRDPSKHLCTTHNYLAIPLNYHSLIDTHPSSSSSRFTCCLSLRLPFNRKVSSHQETRWPVRKTERRRRNDGPPSALSRLNLHTNDEQIQVTFTNFYLKEQDKRENLFFPIWFCPHPPKKITILREGVQVQV